MKKQTTYNISFEDEEASYFDTIEVRLAHRPMKGDIILIPEEKGEAWGEKISAQVWEQLEVTRIFFEESGDISVIVKNF